MGLRVSLRRGEPTAEAADLLVVPVWVGSEKAPHLRQIDRRLGGALRERMRSVGFEARDGRRLFLAGGRGLRARQVVIQGLGRRDPRDGETWRIHGARARQEARALGARRIVCAVVGGGGPEAAVCCLEGLMLAGYRFGKYRSEPDREAIRAVSIAGPEAPSGRAARQEIDRLQEELAAVAFARDLVNEPASVATPRYVAEAARRWLRERDVAAEIWGPRRIGKERLEGLLAVARGSHEEPRFLRLVYRPAGGRPRASVALVGKGLTFDAGGLSLKTPKAMETMKLDMSGAAAVIATLGLVGRLRPQVEVRGYVPLTENLPGGRAQKPGDVIRYRSGKTVEVVNTDAEGRLVLADALAHAAAARPDVLIDLATLTGACMVALGTQVAGLFGNDEALKEALAGHGKAVGETLWPLPLVQDYKDDLKSPVADLKNVGGSYGGAIAGALFLEEFVGGCRWAHLDIAGPAFTEKDLPYAPKGGTGFGVRTLARYLCSL